MKKLELLEQLYEAGSEDELKPEVETQDDKITI